MMAKGMRADDIYRFCCTVDSGVMFVPGEADARGGSQTRGQADVPGVMDVPGEADARGAKDVWIHGSLKTDSRAVQPGDIFLAVRGFEQDGHDYIEQAVKAGAALVICEKEASGDGQTRDDEGGLLGTLAENTPPEKTSGRAQKYRFTGARIEVTSTRRLAGPLAHFMQEHPAKDMTVIGVTGTNGKTTVATLIHQLLTASGRCGTLLGTVEKVFPGGSEKSNLTTTGPVELASDFARAREEGAEFLVMEVSSHALDQHRTDGFDMDAAVFTNLTQDHLDYHGTMDHYARAKRRLFDGLKEGRKAYFYAEDPYASFMAERCRASHVFYGFDEGAGCRAERVEMSLNGSRFDVDGVRYSTVLAGRHNVANVLGALCVVSDVLQGGGRDSGAGLHRSDSEMQKQPLQGSGRDSGAGLQHYDSEMQKQQLQAMLVQALSEVPGPEGRLERVDAAHASFPAVFVDYAHTPDALEHVCKTLKELMPPSCRLHVVFGCGGDRDRGKRPKMGRVAEQLADQITLTSDNPRSEDPLSIIEDILAGCLQPERIECEPDRRKAIRNVVAGAGDKDVILIAGKGHETTQEIQGVRSELDDRHEAGKALRERQKAGGRQGVHERRLPSTRTQREVA